MSIKFWRTILFAAVLMLLLPLSVFAGIYAHDPMENPKAAPEQPKAAEYYYTVVPGDSLWKIALRQYGSGEAWRGIYEENRSVIADAALIYAGQQLRLPAAR